MSQTNVAQFLAAAKQNESLRQRLKSIMNFQNCVDIGRSIGYHFTLEELQAELSKMSNEEVAEIINPGVPPRRHMNSH